MTDMLTLMAHQSRLIQRNLKKLPVKYAIQVLTYILEDLEKTRDQEQTVAERGSQMRQPADEDV